MAIIKKTVIEIKNMSFAFNGENILENVNLKVNKGDFIAIIGPNGGGKTTLLKLILGLYKAQKGIIRVLGQKPEKAASSVGYVPQDVHADHFPIIAIEVVLMGKLGQRKKRGEAAEKEAMDILEKMNMASYAREKITRLSGGQRQRLLIARALISKPGILLLDEPTASIDSRGQAEFFELLKELNKDATILMVSHDLMFVSAHAKSVACVNRELHYHNEKEITTDMMEAMHPGITENECPIELLAHGVPHRVLKIHDK